MPKHGWKWRTERLRAMDDEALQSYLHAHRDKISAKLGRWIYENLEARSEWSAIAGLQRIDWDERAPWGHVYLWRELERRKADPIGDWIIVAMGSGHFPPDAAQHFVAIFDDPSTHPLTRGSAVYGLQNALSSDEDGRLLTKDDALARPVCGRALQDESPYVRSFAVWLAARLGGFDDDIVRLTQDETVVGGGYRFRVCDEAKRALEESRHNSEQGFFADSESS